jgi:YrbI family 3-deoxy-D-manno-octulosonate 8-phosphate phosphatase
LSPTIQFLVVDVDGTLTDGGMYYSESCDEFKKFNTKDGRAMRSLSRKGTPVGILSSGSSANIVKRRADILEVKYHKVNVKSKLEELEKWCDELKIKASEVAFIGDDTNDIEVMKSVGFSACPSDAHPAVKEIANVVLETKGGEGCVREFVDRFMPEVFMKNK